MGVPYLIMVRAAEFGRSGFGRGSRSAAGELQAADAAASCRRGLSCRFCRPARVEPQCSRGY
jgi:hypothetical protein